MPGIDSSAEFGHLLWPQVRQFQETRHIQAKENHMKIRLSTIVLLLGALSAASAQSNRAKPCSNATSAGEWGFTTNGVLVLPTSAVPVTAVGHFIVDLSGNLEGSQVRSVGGGVAHETFTGTVTTNPDCTARYTIRVYDDSGNLVRTSLLDAVFTNGGRKARVVFESITLPDGTSLPSVLSIDGEKL